MNCRLVEVNCTDPPPSRYTRVALLKVLPVIALAEVKLIKVSIEFSC